MKGKRAVLVILMLMIVCMAGSLLYLLFLKAADSQTPLAQTQEEGRFSDFLLPVSEEFPRNLTQLSDGARAEIQAETSGLTVPVFTTAEDIPAIIEQKLQKATADIASQSAEVLAYQEFLEGRRAAAVSDYFYSIVYTEEDLFGGDEIHLEEVANTFLPLYWTGLGKDDLSMDYSLIDCGNDGVYELAVCMGIVNGIDHVTLQLVFHYDGEEVLLTYAAESWTRNYTELNASGYVAGWGSGGADYHYAWYGILDAEGKYESLYETEYTHGGLDGLASEVSLYELLSDKTVLELSKTTIEGRDYYSYYIYDEATEEEREKCEAYIAQSEELNDITFLTSEEEIAVIKKREKEVGVTVETIYQAIYYKVNAITWQNLIHINCFGE